jgi:hypothetical protein
MGWIFVVSVALGGCIGTGSSGPTASPAAPTASVATLPTSPPGTPAPTPIATPSPTSIDEGSVVALVGAFETARSTGDRAAAWALLAPRSQRAIGSMSDFIRLADASVADGGAEFRVVAATQESSRFDPLAIGDANAADLASSLAAGSAWIVDVAHPAMRGASAGSEILAIAPGADGGWRIWIVH